MKRVQPVSSERSRCGRPHEAPDHRTRAARAGHQRAVPLRGHVRRVGQLHDPDVGAQRGPEHARVGERCERVEVAPDDQQRYRRGQRPRGRRHGGPDLARARPVDAAHVRLGVVVDPHPLARGERVERAGRRRGDARAQLGAPDGAGEAHREQLRVVRAGDGPVEPVGVVGGVAAAAVDEAPRLVDHPRQRRRVAGQRRAHRRVELAVDERLGAGVLDQVDDRLDRDPHAPAAAVGGAHRPGQRPGAQPLEQRAEAPYGAPARAARVARADGVERVARDSPRRHVPGVEPAHGIGGVEQDRVQQALVARDERLHEVGPVRVAVQVDPPEPQGPDQRGQVSLSRRRSRTGRATRSAARSPSRNGRPPARTTAPS